MPRYCRKSCKGGVTVEAAIALPLFLFFFLNLLWIIEIYNLHSTLLYALRETGHEMSVYAYAYDEIVNPQEDAGSEAFIENMVFSYLYVRERVEQIAGKEYLDSSPVKGGSGGLFYLESSILQKDDIIDLTVTYKVAPLISLAGYKPSWCYSRYYGRAWTGYDVTENAAHEKGVYVYVTENASVYHLDRECTHISLSISTCRAEDINGARNDSGGRYTACERCGAKYAEIYYITASGDRYHTSLQCSGLKRTVRRIPLEEAEKLYRPCSRCGR